MLRRRARARFFKNRSAVAGLTIISLLVLFATIGPWVADHGPFVSDFVRGVGIDRLPVGPCATFPFGADRVFRDVFARVAYAGRLSLLIAVSATLIASAVGAAVGIVSGYWEGTPVRVPWPLVVGVGASVVAAALGRTYISAAVLATTFCVVLVKRFVGPRVDVDGLLMRLVDILLAFPFLLLILAIGAALDRTTAATIFVTLGLTGWPGTARVLRAKTIQVRCRDYVLAARALGQSTASTLLRHVLPNIAGPLVVTATVQVAQMIVADSALAYLGMGIAPPTPTWGRMLFDGQDYYQTAPWLIVAPGAAILLAVWGFNMLGEGLRDALDPNEV